MNHALNPDHQPRRTASLDTPLGVVTATFRADDHGDALAGLRFDDHDADPTAAPEPPQTQLLRNALNAYFHHHDPNAFDQLHLAPPGTPFQLRVWNELRSVPFGETVSYRTLAERLERPTAARAVGRANATNPIAIIIPCHRVLNSRGQLHGYAYGLRRKHQLLQHEGVLLDRSG